MLLILWIGGGASRADVMGQVFVRAGAWIVLIAFILFGRRPHLHTIAPVAFVVLTSAFLVALQLIPLPPTIWAALPGREMLEQAAVATGEGQPWRPLSLSPGATFNALSSLIVPVAALLPLAALSGADHWRLATLLLGLVIASALIGLLQFSGGHFDHLLINDAPRAVSAIFANRNHFALFAAIGSVLVPAWAFHDERQKRWKAPLALVLLLFLALIILATGSRSGMMVGALGVPLGILNMRRPIMTELRRLPKPVSWTLIAVIVAIPLATIVLSVALGRAVSVDRLVELDAGDDLRRQALPTVWAMIQFYFPFGTGAGAFDPAYRIHEPDALLSAAYFNHAHNDLLEVVLDAGLAGALLLLGAIGWWLWRSINVWRSDSSRDGLARAGSAILLLTLAASVTDYPVRTPMIMAVVVIAAVWLNNRPRHAEEAGSSRRHERRATGP